MTSTELSAMPRREPRRIPFPLQPLAAAFALAQIAGTALAADGVVHVVNTCVDSPLLPDCSQGDDGTLRHAFRCAQDGDTVDLTQLKCSTITLTSPLISGPVGLTLSGPGAANLTISAGNQFRALVHNGQPGATLLVSGMTIRNGSYDNPYNYLEGGGCIFSSANVYLVGTNVTSCYTSASSAVAVGGAILARGTVTLVGSAVTGSTATGLADTKYAAARGGGIYADTVNVYDSVVSSNTALSPTKTTYGGGIYAKHFKAAYSTISGNNATSRAGVAAGQSFVMMNSTISSNTARDFDAGAHLLIGTAEIYNSTIAFNAAAAYGSTGGISAGALHLESTIVARNTSGGVQSDVYTFADGISGTHNLIMVSNVNVPPDTITEDPLLGPLQDNGGPSPTHALFKGSPAIDHGSNPQGFDSDQRFVPRQLAAAPDIGAFESDALFANGFEADLGPEAVQPPTGYSPTASTGHP